MLRLRQPWLSDNADQRAHPRFARIVHAMGDATGLEVANTLIRVARQTEQVRIFEDCFAIDLVEQDGRCCAAIT